MGFFGFAYVTCRRFEGREIKTVARVNIHATAKVRTLTRYLLPLPGLYPVSPNRLNNFLSQNGFLLGERIKP